MFVLDLAPTMGRNFAGFPLDEERQSQEAVTDQAATNNGWSVLSIGMIISCLQDRIHPNIKLHYHLMQQVFHHQQQTKTIMLLPVGIITSIVVRRVPW